MRSSLVTYERDEQAQNFVEGLENQILIKNESQETFVEAMESDIKSPKKGEVKIESESSDGLLNFQNL
jgi:hypothetical protein